MPEPPKPHRRRNGPRPDEPSAADRRRRDRARRPFGAARAACKRCATSGYDDAARYRRRRLPRARAALRRRLSPIERCPLEAGERRRGRQRRARVRLLCGVAGDDTTLPSVMDMWPNADWAEREVFDLFGIVFDGHADLRRIQMPYDWEGHPLRKDYPMRGPARERSPRPAFRAARPTCAAGTPPSGNVRSKRCKNKSRAREVVSPGEQPVTPEVVSAAGNSMVISMGPQHPSTHGVLQIVVEIERRERHQGAEPEIGYLHTGIEKTAENLFWTQAQTGDRAHGLPRAGVQRAVLRAWRSKSCWASPIAFPARAASHSRADLELTRIASHCVWLGTHGIDIGAISIFFYASTSARTSSTCKRPPAVRACTQLHARRRYQRRLAGRIISNGSTRSSRSSRDACATCARLLQANPIFQDRTIDVGISRRKRRSAGALPVQCCAPAASPTTCARRSRTAATRTTRSTFRRVPKATPTRASSCVSTRWTKSMRIVEQARKALNEPGPVMIDDPKVAAPPKETIALSMEALIHHFKIVSEGFRVPPGDIYQAIEGPRGELGYYIVTQRRQPPVPRTHPSALALQPSSAQRPSRRATSSPTSSS